MIAFKGFGKDMKCNGFQYKEGKTFETDKAKLCSSGFHACERPLDVFGYYPPADSVYHEVKLDEVSDERSSDDTKIVGKRIKIGARLSIRELVNAQIEYVREHCTNENNADAGKPATAGFRGAATAGDSGAATAGNYGAATSRGKSSVGENGIACARGNGCMVRGGIGAILVIGEENKYDCDIRFWKAVQVDGETIKADTWYKLQNGELVEAEEDSPEVEE